MKSLTSWLSMLGLSLWLGLSLAHAADEPMTLLQSISNQVISELKANKAQLKTNKALPNKIVYRYLLPHVDLEGMSRTVIGRNAWISASAEQKARFTKEFTFLVVNTYSGALKDYSDETVQFAPNRAGAGQDNFASVKSTIVRSSGPDIPMSYSLVRKNQSWKIYDMSVEGVSLLQSFRSQFESKLRSNGFESVIQDLATQNQKIRQRA